MAGMLQMRPGSCEGLSVLFGHMHAMAACTGRPLAHRPMVLYCGGRSERCVNVHLLIGSKPYKLGAEVARGYCRIMLILYNNLIQCWHRDNWDAIIIAVLPCEIKKFWEGREVIREPSRYGRSQSPGSYALRRVSLASCITIDPFHPAHMEGTYLTKTNS